MIEQQLQNHNKSLKVLYISPIESKNTGVADYAIKFKKCLESYSKDLKINMENPFHFQSNYSILDLLKIKKEVHMLKKDYNLIHAEMSSSSYAEFWYLYFSMKKSPNIPVILTIHDSPYLCLNPFHIFFFKNYRKYFLFKSFRKFLDVLIGYTVERYIVKKVKFVFVTTKIGLEKFKQRFKINYIGYLPHLTFNEMEMKDEKYKDKNYILFFGFILKGKGIDVLIDAFYKLLTETNDLKENTKLIICGGYEENDKYFRQIKKKISALNLSENVEIKGYVEIDYLLNLFKEAIFVVFPYLSKTTYSSSGALIRALGAGCPVIVSDIPMLTEYIKDGVNGLIFKEGDSKDLCSKLIMLIKNSQLRWKLSKNAIEYIKKEHNDQLIVEKVLKKYIEVTGL